MQEKNNIKQPGIQYMEDNFQLSLYDARTHGLCVQLILFHSRARLHYGTMSLS